MIQKKWEVLILAQDKIIRWLVRGDTIYDVTVPDDAEIIDCESPSAPHGVFRSNKIIITNPRVVTDEMAMDFPINRICQKNLILKQWQDVL